MSTDLIAASKAPAAVASALDMHEGRAAALIEVAGVRPVRKGLRYWYRREDIDALVSRQQAPAACRVCREPIRFLGGMWTAPDGNTECMAAPGTDWADHEPEPAGARENAR